jgi:multimeric flavodoxin WrbA
MKHIIAVNAGPRKGWNTDLLLREALKGAESEGAKATLVHLRDMSFGGCSSCLECKRKDRADLKLCVLRDDLMPVLEGISSCDGLIIGSPIYFGNVTGMARSFMERLLFQYISYDEDRKPITPRPIPNAFIYTMNVPESLAGNIGYVGKFEETESILGRILGPSQWMMCTETLQVNDYSKYRMSSFNGEERHKRRKEVFPSDLQKAFEIGRKLA